MLDMAQKKPIGSALEGCQALASENSFLKSVPKFRYSDKERSCMMFCAISWNLESEAVSCFGTTRPSSWRIGRWDEVRQSVVFSVLDLIQHAQ